MKKVIRIALLVLIASTASPLLANIPEPVHTMNLPVNQSAIHQLIQMNNEQGNEAAKPIKKHELRKNMKMIQQNSKADSSVLIVISSTALLIIIILLLIIIF